MPLWQSKLGANNPYLKSSNPIILPSPRGAVSADSQFASELLQPLVTFGSISVCPRACLFHYSTASIRLLATYAVDVETPHGPNVTL